MQTKFNSALKQLYKRKKCNCEVSSVFIQFFSITERSSKYEMSSVKRCHHSVQFSSSSVSRLQPN